MEIEVNGNIISYKVVGHGQPIVLIHGFGGNQAVWAGQVDFLANKGFQVITYDQIGHGATIGNAALKIATLIDSLESFLSKLHIVNPILVGHSMGSSVIWGLIKKFPDFPIKAIVTIDQSPKMLNDQFWDYGYQNLNKYNFVSKLIDPPYVKETLNGIHESVWKELKPYKELHPFNRQKNLELMIDHIQKDWRPIVYKIKQPYAMFTSTRSPYFKYGYTNLAKKKNSNIDVIEVHDTGHDIMAENPSEFNRLLFNFLKISTEGVKR